MQVLPGSPFPLGATYDGQGVNFSIYSENAEAVDLCLFDSDAPKAHEERLPVNDKSHFIWHCYVKGIKPGQLYGYRIKGKYEPQNGHRFNYNKLLLDPYAKAIADSIKLRPELYGYNQGNGDDLSFSTSDSAPFAPKAIVTDDNYDWQGDKPPRTPYHKTIIYEAHVKGFTQMLPGLPNELRGTYSGLAHPVAINYLKKLGITALELMPVHQFIDDGFLTDKGLRNYWGYNTIGFFAPDSRYGCNNSGHNHVNQFKAMVKALHAAGIEVIMDVVYNHTAEGNEMGPTLSFKGIDNAAYYRLVEDDKRYYMDYTSTGNTLNANLPGVLRLIMDSLRYWITEMHIDGFRFDLASTLARELKEVNKLSAFFDIIYQDPVISQVKLIAEPWDLGDDGYQVGKFPPGWGEWNGLYRDCVRDYWRGAESKLAEFAERFTGSSDLYKEDYRFPTASINFITAHDGFTLRDLVSYNDKHNEANQDNNTDGNDDNKSWNCGQEGETDNEEINKLRNRQQRNFLATLFLSQGVPMLLSGDETGNSQQGNNNSYCQDNELAWLNWDKADNQLLQFTQCLTAFRKKHPAFSRKHWFKGKPVRHSDLLDIAWFLPEGGELSEDNWKNDYAKSLAVYLNGNGLVMIDDEGRRVVDDNFYIIFNAYEGSLNYKLPAESYGHNWVKVIDTYTGQCTKTSAHKAGDVICVESRSVVVFQNDYVGTTN